MDLRTLKSKLTKEQYSALARRVGTSPGYLDQLAGRHRSPSVKLARKLAGADRRLSLEELLPGVYGDAA